MIIPVKIKLLTPTAKMPEAANDGDLYDLFADGFCVNNLKDGIIRNEIPFNEIYHYDWHLSKDSKPITQITHYNKYESLKIDEPLCKLNPLGRILVKTGIALELPKQYDYSNADTSFKIQKWWIFDNDFNGDASYSLASYAVADLRPRSGLALKHGITILNSPATIDNSYRKEIGIIVINHGHEPYTIKKGDKVAQMLIRPLYLSKLIQVEDFEDTGRGGYGSTGK